MMTAARAFVVPGAIWIITAAFIISASRLGPVARAMPLLVGWLTLLLVTIDIVAHTDTRAGRALTSALNPAALVPADADQPGGSRRAFWVGVAPVLALIAGFALIGVLPSVPVFVFASLRWRARRGIVTSALVAVLVTLFVYGMFYKVLQLPLYPGLLFGGAWQ
jgi:hypothetical protein